MKLKLFLIFGFVITIGMGLAFGFYRMVYAEEEVSTSYYSIFYQEPADVHLGKAGVFMLSSSYNAVATINRFDIDIHLTI